MFFLPYSTNQSKSEVKPRFKGGKIASISWWEEMKRHVARGIDSGRETCFAINLRCICSFPTGRKSENSSLPIINKTSKYIVSTYYIHQSKNCNQNFLLYILSLIFYFYIPWKLIFYHVSIMVGDQKVKLDSVFVPHSRKTLITILLNV